MIKRFEDIISWQKSKQLTTNLYDLFRTNKDFSFKDQIQRASVSIMNNIAEGFERGSNRDFVKFLYIARASCGEVRSMLYLSKDLNYISEENFIHLYRLCLEISKLIYRLIQKIYHNQNGK